jgi:hypothetical protein
VAIRRAAVPDNDTVTVIAALPCLSLLSWRRQERGIPVTEYMRHYRLPAGEETLDFTGRLIDKTDTDSGDRLRWAELQLYKILDTNPEHDGNCPDEENRNMLGKELWLLYTIGHTLVYHAADGCKKGVRMPARDFPSRAENVNELEPCEECNPGDWQGSEEEFRLEITWYSYTPCQSAERVIESLYREPRCSSCRHKPHEGYCRCGCERYREAPRSLSNPGRQLIEQVRQVDPEIARAAAKVRKF